MKKKIIIVSLLCLCLCSEALAYRINRTIKGAPIKRSEARLIMKVTGGMDPAVVKNAMAIWNSVETSSFVMSVGNSADTIKVGKLPKNIAGETKTWYNVGTGIILDSHITIIKQFKESRIVVGHELGHTLSLDHSENRDALMWREYTGKQGLTQDDRNGISELYPKGDSGGGGGGGGCFITTAAYGSELAEEVVLFKKFRDDYLVKTEAGRAVMKFYYRYSPYYADIIRKDNETRAAIRALLWPMATALEIHYREGSPSSSSKD